MPSPLLFPLLLLILLWCCCFDSAFVNGQEFAALSDAFNSPALLSWAIVDCNNDGVDDLVGIDSSGIRVWQSDGAGVFVDLGGLKPTS